MAGTKAGAAKARDTIIRVYGEDYFHKIGKVGGANGHTGGFYANRELAREAGRKGGTVSRRRKVKETA